MINKNDKKKLRQLVKKVLNNITGQYQYDIFISYRRSESSDFATAVHEAIKTCFHPITRKRLRIFIDTEIYPGSNFHIDIQHAISSSACYLILLSPDYGKTEYTKFEEMLISGRDWAGVKGRVIPIIVKGCIIPHRLSGIQALDFTKDRSPISSSSNIPSPFKSYGTLPPNSKCYVSRLCDRKLSSLSKTENRIWIQGGFQIGKSSLLIRYENWAPDGWIAIYPDLEICSNDTPKSFSDDFFSEISEKILSESRLSSSSQIQKWKDLENFLLEDNRNKIIIVLDEAGRCHKEKGGDIFMKLFHLTEKSKNLKIIAASNKTITNLLHSYYKIENHKYYTEWKSIQIKSFNEENIHHLTQLFPSYPINLSFIINEYTKEILETTGGSPNKIQKVLDRIWTHVSQFQSEQEAQDTIKKLIGDF